MVVQGVPLRLQWSDLARTQSFVVMVRDWIDYLAQPRATQYNLQPGEPIVMRLQSSSELDAGIPQDSPTGLLTTPGGDAIELTAERRDDGFVFRSSRTRLPGDYKLELGLAGQAIPFHVLRDSGESDLDTLSPAAEQQIAASTKPNPTAEHLAANAPTQSDPLWPYLLIGLILLITAELVLSGVLSRERFGSAGIPEFSDLDAPAVGSVTGVESFGLPAVLVAPGSLDQSRLVGGELTDESDRNDKQPIRFAGSPIQPPVDRAGDVRLRRRHALDAVSRAKHFGHEHNGPVRCVSHGCDRDRDLDAVGSHERLGRIHLDTKSGRDRD